MLEFDAVATPTPVKPPELELVLKVRLNPDATRSYEGTFHFTIPTSDGREIERRRGNLVPHLTDTQKAALKNFMDEMFTKARATVP